MASSNDLDQLSSQSTIKLVARAQPEKDASLASQTTKVSQATAQQDFSASDESNPSFTDLPPGFKLPPTPTPPADLPSSYENIPEFIVKKTPEGVQFIRQSEDPAKDNKVHKNYTHPPSDIVVFVDFYGEPKDVAVYSKDGGLRIIPAGTDATPADFSDGDRIYYPQIEQIQEKSKIEEQISALQNDLPVGVQETLNYFENQYREILKNPNVQQAAQQLEQWLKQFQNINKLPRRKRTGY